MKQPLGLSAFSAGQFGTPDDVERLARLLLSYGDAFTPTRFGVYEPLKKKFSEHGLDALASEILHGFLYWKSTRTSATVNKHIPGYMHGAVKLDMAQDILSPDHLGRLLCDVAREIQADLGAVHLLNDHDREFDSSVGSRIDAADGSSFRLYPKELGNGLPNLYWGMVFGKAYCEMFGVERLMSTPSYLVRQLDEKLIYLQLTADVNDCQHNHAAIMRARYLAKKHLGSDAFMPDERDGLLSRARQLPLIGKLLGRKPLAPLLVP